MHWSCALVVISTPLERGKKCTTECDKWLGYHLSLLSLSHSASLTFSLPFSRPPPPPLSLPLSLPLTSSHTTCSDVIQRLCVGVISPFSGLRAFNSQLNGAQQMTQKLTLLTFTSQCITQSRQSSSLHYLHAHVHVPNDNQPVNVHYRASFESRRYYVQYYWLRSQPGWCVLLCTTYLCMCTCVHPHWNSYWNIVYYCILYTRHTEREVMLLTVCITVYLFMKHHCLLYQNYRYDNHS